ncbi:hypothetical protein ACU686_29495 [Yinghuangia aomiensis]
MSLDPRTPVLVGVAAAVRQRVDEPGGGRDALELMADAAEAAGHDSGAADLLGALDMVLIPRGMWGQGDPGRRIADRFGASKARTLVAELGVLQQTLLTRAAAGIAAGNEDVVLVVGAEAAYRDRRLRGTGLPPIHQPLPPIEPDVSLRPTGDILHRVEIDRGLPVPVRQYAILESALPARRGPVARRARRRRRRAVVEVRRPCRRKPGRVAPPRRRARGDRRGVPGEPDAVPPLHALALLARGRRPGRRADPVLGGSRRAVRGAARPPGVPVGRRRVEPDGADRRAGTAAPGRRGSPRSGRGCPRTPASRPPTRSTSTCTAASRRPCASSGPNSGSGTATTRR